MTTLLLTLAFFGFAVLIMAVGVIFKRPCLRGSCGGADVLDSAGEPLSCATCPKRKERLEKMARMASEAGGGADVRPSRLPVV